MGFTLAELLSALAILGVIATFTIPKVLSSSQNGQKVAIAKEFASSISAAYQAYSLNTTPTATTNATDLMALMNYVRVDSSSSVDDVPFFNNINCAAAHTCYTLHNGATAVIYNGSQPFGGTAATDYMAFQIDPDSTYSGSTTGDGKGVEFFLYFNGRIVSKADSTGNTAHNPSWFSW